MFHKKLRDNIQILIKALQEIRNRFVEVIKKASRKNERKYVPRDKEEKRKKELEAQYQKIEDEYNACLDRIERLFFAYFNKKIAQSYFGDISNMKRYFPRTIYDPIFNGSRIDYVSSIDNQIRALNDIKDEISRGVIRRNGEESKILILKDILVAIGATTILYLLFSLLITNLLKALFPLQAKISSVVLMFVLFLHVFIPKIREKIWPLISGIALALLSYFSGELTKLFDSLSK